MLVQRPIFPYKVYGLRRINPTEPYHETEKESVKGKEEKKKEQEEDKSEEDTRKNVEEKKRREWRRKIIG